MENGNRNALSSNLSFYVNLVKALEFSQTFFDEYSSIEPWSSDFANKFVVFWYDQEHKTNESSSDEEESSSDEEALMNVLITEDLHESYLDFSDDNKKVLILPSYWYEKEELNKFSASDFDLSTFQNFLAVRHITLSMVELTSDALVGLISECEFLEVLSLKKCRNLNSVDIPRNRLRSLSIEDCSPLKHGINVFSKCLRSFTLSQPFETLFSIPDRIQELDLESSDDSVPLPMIPSYLNDFQEMIKLKLSGYDLSDLSYTYRNVEAIRLNEIVLCRVNLTSDSLRWLFLNCTSLQNLSLKKCRKLLVIAHPMTSLRSLIIDDCSSVVYGPLIRSTTLQSFKYRGLPQHALRLGNLDSLQEGELDFGLRREHKPERPWSYYVYWLHYKILKNMCFATVLSVCSFVTQVVSARVTSKSGISFDNVTHLKLKTGLSPIEFDGILTLLKCCPKLKTLSVQMGQTLHLKGLEKPTNLDKFWEQLISPVDQSLENTEYPFLTSMEVVEMENFSGGDQEMQFLKFFLRNGQNLKQMVITTSKNVNPDLHMDKAKSLLEVPKASPGANVSIQLTRNCDMLRPQRYLS